MSEVAFYSSPFAVVVVPLPLRMRLTYRIPDGMRVGLGMRVLVPLGPRRVTGYVVGEEEKAPEGIQIRAIADVLDDRPLFTPESLRFFSWVAEYYHESLGEVIATALPGGLNHKDLRVVSLTEEGQREWRSGIHNGSAAGILLAAIGEETRTASHVMKSLSISMAEIFRAQKEGWVHLRYELRAGSAKRRKERVALYAGEPTKPLVSSKEKKVFAAIKEAGEIDVRSLNETFKNVRNDLIRLEASGAIRMEERRVFRDVLGRQTFLSAEKHEIPELTPEQAPIVARLSDAVREQKGRFLLHGVTGSGKTEVYLRAIETVLAEGKGAIVLVPEIALTPQLASRFQGRFGDAIALLHSGLSPGERLDQWSEIAEGRRSVVVGARSAVFAPMPRLGLIVVDEEHEPSFKQEDRPRYHARDVAMVRGSISKCPVILGSATPCLESVLNAKDGRYELLEMRSRVQNRPLPDVELVDLRTDRAAGKHAMISPKLAEAMKETLDRGQQVILFLNRRGFSSFVLCTDCGHIDPCPACSISLSYTRRYEKVRCHYCGFSRQPPSTCESCKGSSFQAVGSGTERVEEEVRALVGEAIGIARLDRDTAQGKGLLEVLQNFRDRKTQILIGTQMVAKGHDFPGVTLVGVLMADQGLRFPDFRAGERTYQLMTQVAGRAGRGEMPGRVIVQSYDPEHYVLQAVKAHDPGSFLERELAERKAYGYPPYSYLSLIKITHEDPGEAQARGLRAMESLRQNAQAENAGDSLLILGPTYAPIQRIKNKTRMHLLLKCSNRELLHRVLHRFVAYLDDGNLWSSVALDVDPNNLL